MILRDLSQRRDTISECSHPQNVRNFREIPQTVDSGRRVKEISNVQPNDSAIEAMARNELFRLFVRNGRMRYLEV